MMRHHAHAASALAGIAIAVSLWACVAGQGTEPVAARAAEVRGGSSALVHGARGGASVSHVPVGWLTISPGRATLQVGMTLRLPVTVHDRSGRPVFDRVVTWSSAAPRVATVSPAGEVTAVSAGTVEITATSEGISVSVRLTVAPPPGKPRPTGPLGCPAATIGAHGFDDGTFGPFTNGGYTLVKDATATGGWSATHSWQRLGVETYAGINAMFDGVPRVYARWRYKQDSAFEDDVAVKKLLFTKGPEFSLGTGLLVIANDRFMWYYDQLGDGQTNYFTNVGTEVHPSALRGDWHWYELMNDISTSGALHMRLWVDGVLKMDHVVARPNQGKLIGTVSFNGTTNAPGTNGTDWLDELAVSSECIGTPQ